jgi:hypothetical protein
MKALVLTVGIAGAAVLAAYALHARVIRELREHPDGTRAKEVMLISLPSGRTFPVNYRREDGVVWAAADTRWWRELVGDGADVTVLIRGERLRGRARAVEDDPALRSAVFARLRPSAPSFFGVLVEIRLAPADSALTTSRPTA